MTFLRVTFYRASIAETGENFLIGVFYLSAFSKTSLVNGASTLIGFFESTILTLCSILSLDQVMAVSLPPSSSD